MYFGGVQALTQVLVLSIIYGVPPPQPPQVKLPRVSLTAVIFAYFSVAAGYPKFEVLSLKSSVFVAPAN
jgi:hypothetical protein